jgi:hypothetical protein
MARDYFHVPREYENQVVAASAAQGQAGANSISQNDSRGGWWVDHASLAGVGVDHLFIVVTLTSGGSEASL